MKIRSILAYLVSVILLTLFVAPSVFAQDGKGEIRERMKKRYPALKEMKEQQKIGETHLGFVEALTDELAKDKAVSQIVSGENADREALYKIIAKETDTTPEVVGKNNALRIFEKAGDEEYFKGKDDKWRQKKDMKK